MSVRGILVAGGLGRRLAAGSPKALVTLGGRTLFERALETLSAVADETVVAAPDSIDLPTLPRIRRVFDRSPSGGPLAGIAAAMEEGGFEVAVVLGVDFPFMTPAFLESLVSRLAHTPGLRALVPAPGGRLQPLAAVYSRTFADGLVASFAAGERSIVSAVERLSAEVLADDELRECPGGIECFFNLNTPEDLLEAERRIAAQGVKR